MTGTQPEHVFGMGAIQGLTDDAIAKVVYRQCPDATLTGGTIAAWPSMIDARFRARPKTW
jgi:hypothetical protein